MNPSPGVLFDVDGRLIDMILGLMAAESLLLVVLRRRWTRGPRLGLLIPNMAAGGFLLFGLREALVGAASYAIALCLLGALIAHLIDLWARWRA